MATKQYVMMAQYTCVLTAFIVVLKKILLLGVA